MYFKSSLLNLRVSKGKDSENYVISEIEGCDCCGLLWSLLVNQQWNFTVSQPQHLQSELSLEW